MRKTNWNADWRFWTDRNAFMMGWQTPEDAAHVTLPHDAMIGLEPHADSLNKGHSGYRDGSVLQYAKRFSVPQDVSERTWTLTFEGVHMNTFVYVNGALAAKRPNGYATFHMPLDDFLKPGAENEIRVTVRNGAMPNSRWYSGGGIYRDVWLRESGWTYLVPDGVRLTTETLDNRKAVVRVATTVCNRHPGPRHVRLETRLLDAAGVGKAEECVPLLLKGGETRTLERRLVVENPAPWSDESPILYRCVSRLLPAASTSAMTDAKTDAKTDAVRLDEEETTFGIRILSLDAVDGLRVNGKTVKLRGACIHHDSGLLGAATYEDAQYRQIRLMREAGFNAVRMSHHPMAPAMLRACDALGMYVMDEAFDMWTRNKSDYDYGMSFDEWWRQDLDAMVAKDYNHPSVVLYSLGNEIPDLGNAHGASLCHRMHERVKGQDPTRYTLSGINGVFMAADAMPVIMRDVLDGLRAEGRPDESVNHFMTLMDKHMDRIVVHPEISRRLDEACATTDVAGYNYMAARYASDGRERPHRVIVGSETYPPKIPRNWALVTGQPHVIGDFTWTGWDYIGEAGVGVPAYAPGEGGFGAQFPCALAYVGDIDITGFRRPASYFREIVFGLRHGPYLTVQNPHRFGQPVRKTPWIISDSQSSWTWTGCEGKPAMVEIFAAGDMVELFQDGVSLGVKPAGKAVGYRTLFETTYAPGELKAVGYVTEAGVRRELGTMVLRTAGKAVGLRTEVEEGSSGNMVWVRLEACDAAGMPVGDCADELTAVVENGLLMGFGSGNPKDLPAQPAERARLFEGRAQLIVRKTAPGTTVRVTSERLGESIITL